MRRFPCFIHLYKHAMVYAFRFRCADIWISYYIHKYSTENSTDGWGVPHERSWMLIGWKSGDREIMRRERTRPRGCFFSTSFLLPFWDDANTIIYIFFWMPSSYRGNQADPCWDHPLSIYIYQNPRIARVYTAPNTFFFRTFRLLSRSASIRVDVVEVRNG